MRTEADHEHDAQDKKKKNTTFQKGLTDILMNLNKAEAD